MIKINFDLRMMLGKKEMLKGLAFLLKRCVQYQKKETIFCFTFAFLYMGIAKKAGRHCNLLQESTWVIHYGGKK